MSDKDPLTTQELYRRARELLRLGNSPKQIRLILSRLKVTPKQVNVVMAAIESKTRQRQKADSIFVWALAVAAILFFAVIMLAGAYGLGNRAVSGGTPGKPGPTKTVSVQGMAQTLIPNIPSQFIQNMIPSDVPANFMFATPVVMVQATSVSGNTRIGCPSSEGTAAKLFGGEASEWAYDRSTKGWTMTSVAKAVTITVPEGFAAGYLVMVNGPEIRSVNGPAILQGINFIAMSCP